MADTTHMSNRKNTLKARNHLVNAKIAYRNREITEAQLKTAIREAARIRRAV